MSARLHLLAPALLLATATPALAQPEPGTERIIINLIVYGEDACPEPAAEDEIVVCGRRPESERYRIPRELRERTDRPLETSWAARALDLEDAQRDTRPNSCSPVGSFGQTGCTQAMIRQWMAERRAMQARRW